MGTMGGFDVEAGWYPDPLDRGAHRYWDGDGWTDQVVRAVPSGVDVDEWLDTARSARPLVLATASSGSSAVDQGGTDRGRTERLARWAWVMSALAVLGSAFLVVGLVAASDQGATQMADAPATTAEQPDGAALATPQATVAPATDGGGDEGARLAPIPSTPPVSPAPPVTTPATGAASAPSATAASTGTGVSTAPPTTAGASTIGSGAPAPSASAPVTAPPPQPPLPPTTAPAATGPTAVQAAPTTTVPTVAPTAPADAPGPAVTATTAVAPAAGTKSSGPLASTRVVITARAGCSPHYDGCVPVALDVDCAGTGDGPAFFAGTAQVRDVDVYGLDGDGDGTACN